MDVVKMTYSRTDDPPRMLSYLEIDTALRDAYFNSGRAGESVYLDLDEDVVREAAEPLGLDPEPLLGNLVTAVGDLITKTATGGMLGHFNGLLSNWQRSFRKSLRAGDASDGPPVVGLLAVFTLAAEQMGDSEFHDNAYYARLVKLLRVPEGEHKRFVAAFGRDSEAYWGALKVWLEALDGKRGLPTASALSHRYIGLPISQALIRETERRKLSLMFEEMSLPANSAISHGDMESTLDQWINAEHSAASRNLIALWNRSAARERVVDVALTEFERWDGAVKHNSGLGSDTDRAIRSVRLGMVDSSDWLHRTFELAAVMPANDQIDGPYSLQVGEEQVTVQSVPLGPSMDAVPFTSTGIDAASALAGVLRFSRLAVQVMVRYPRKVIPLLLDPMTRAYLETERLAAGEESALLVRDQDHIVTQVEEVLIGCARPGYEKHRAGSGIPAGWVLFIGVVAVTAPANSATGPLAVLEPRLSRQMALTGGFRMPGRITKWSALDVPDLTVVSDAQEVLTVELIEREIDGKGARTTIAKSTAPFVITLADHVKSSGNYELLLSHGTSKLQRLDLRIRSAADPDQYSWKLMRGIGHVPSDPMWPIRAIEVPAVDGPVIDGAVVVDSEGFTERAARVAVSQSASTFETENLFVGDVNANLVIPLPDNSSCIQTGAHRFHLPRWEGGQGDRFVVGRCEQCGMSKRFPGRFWDKSLAKKNSSIDIAVPVGDLKPMHQPGRSNWRAAIDTLVYLGQGNARELSHIARQVENSSIFEATFTRGLEALGIIETERDADLRIKGFEVAATALAELSDLGFVLTGSMAIQDVDAYFTQITEGGYAADYLDRDQASMLFVPSAAADAIDFDDAAATVRSAGMGLLMHLPHIATTISSLPQISMPPRARDMSVFSPADARWHPFRGDAGAGVFREKRIDGNQHLLRTVEDVVANKCRRVSMDVGKYLAAWMTRRCLPAFDAASSTLRVPLGAPLPGLYERAAVLCSGILPATESKSGRLVYSKITRPFADALIERLS